MALLSLKDVGKIYVSEGNVTVGIRGVNLSFDRGEFVAITGKSGSGKSTLLNVISGMDSYEEGELYIEGQTTSHYLQPEWEEYREKYISFIFQDYNIIESFTVLQNVELALMHIEDKKARRERAMELIRRVGLASHVKQKGSKLSGGQKQRTVIARALAKDSPIILADEPTGNLDSATSKEIISLLREVSEDKLLIVVTHNFEQVEDCATRHVRIFDGAVEADHVIRDAAKKESDEKTDEITQKCDKNREKREKRKQIRNGITLGKTIFLSKPKLSVFLCFLMIVGTLGIFLVTALCGDAAAIFEPYYMFNHIDGRLVLTKQSGETFAKGEIESIAKEYGARDYLRYDVLLDEGINRYIEIPVDPDAWEYEYASVNYTFGKTYGDKIIGRYPEESNEVFLYLPISYQTVLGKDSLAVDRVVISGIDYSLVGVKYYYDNNLTGECLFTESGFRTATAVYYISETSDCNTSVSLKTPDSAKQYYLNNIVPSFTIAKDKIYIDSSDYDGYLESLKVAGVDYEILVDFSATYHKYNYYNGESGTYTFTKSFDEKSITDVVPEGYLVADYSRDVLLVSDEMMCEIAESVLEDSYKQVSLFFENDKAAHAAAERLQTAGYIAVPSDTTYEPDAMTAMMNVLGGLMVAISWFLSIVFLAFFINLCSSRTLGAFKGDMAIMRSMGIQVKVIRVGMYVRMVISLIPAFILLAATAILIFTTPKFNEYFVYLYAWQYALIVLGMLILTVRITYKQINKLFGESVKKSLKGGHAE